MSERDIVERLRNTFRAPTSRYSTPPILEEAADRIEALEAEIERLRAETPTGSDTNVSGYMCLRDDTVELRVPGGPWYRADQRGGTLDLMAAPTETPSPEQGEVERLREALEPFARFACGDPEGTARDGCDCHNCNARRALSTKGGTDEVE